MIKKDPVLSKIDQQDREKLDKEIEDNIGEIGIKHLQHLFQDSRSSSITIDSSYINPQPNNSNKSNPDFDIHKMTRVSRGMIRVRHPNLNYRREMEEFRNGLRKEKPKRKTSSCYFDPWKQSDDVIAQLMNKEKIHLVHKITR